PPATYPLSLHDALPICSRRRRSMPELRVIPVAGLPEIGDGDDLGALISERAELEDGDVIVVAQKVVSKAEGRVVRLADVEPSARDRKSTRLNSSHLVIS